MQKSGWVEFKVVNRGDQIEAQGKSFSAVAIFVNQYLRQFLAKHSATLYLAVNGAAQPPDVGGEIAIQDFGEGIVNSNRKIPPYPSGDTEWAFP